jgi:hypothetical protein
MCFYKYVCKRIFIHAAHFNLSAIFLFPAFLLLTVVVLGQNDKITNLKKDKQKLEEEIEFNNKLLKETKKSTQISLNQIIILNNKISIRSELIQSISNDIHSIG